MAEHLNPPTNEKPLEGWKEIGSYLQRDESTARRWEREENLPIRRHAHRTGTSVYALPSQIDAWRAARQPQLQPSKESWRASKLIWVATSVVVLLGAFAWLLRTRGLSPVAEAQAPGSDIRVTEVCADCDFLGSPSPDGRYLSQTDWSSGDLAIYDFESRESRRVTNKESSSAGAGQAYRSIFSPDGRFIAFKGLSSARTSIRIIALLRYESRRSVRGNSVRQGSEKPEQEIPPFIRRTRGYGDCSKP